MKSLQLEVGQIWRCYNSDIVEVSKYHDYMDVSDITGWQYQVTIIAEHSNPIQKSSIIEDFYDVTGEGHFWEGGMVDTDIDRGHNLKEMLSKEENPEYYL